MGRSRGVEFLDRVLLYLEELVYYIWRRVLVFVDGRTHGNRRGDRGAFTDRWGLLNSCFLLSSVYYPKIDFRIRNISMRQLFTSLTRV